jgi:transposase
MVSRICISLLQVLSYSQSDLGHFRRKLGGEKKVQILKRLLRHAGQSIRIISRTSKVSSSAVAKTIKRYDETGSHEDRHRKRRPRVTYAAEDKFIVTSLAAQINASQSSSNRHISTSTVQKRQHEIRPSWSNCCK